MTRLILRAIDVGASIVFMALCAKAFFRHFYKDVKWCLGKTDAGSSIEQGDGGYVRHHRRCLEHARYCEWYAAHTKDEKDRKYLIQKARDWTRLAAKKELDVRWMVAQAAA